MWSYVSGFIHLVRFEVNPFCYMYQLFFVSFLIAKQYSDLIIFLAFPYFLAPVFQAYLLFSLSQTCNQPFFWDSCGLSFYVNILSSFIEVLIGAFPNLFEGH